MEFNLLNIKRKALTTIAAAAALWLCGPTQVLAADAPVIHGNIVGPAAYVDYTSGIYRFQAKAPIALDLQKQSMFIAVNGGGDNVDGLYHYISNNDGLGTAYAYRMYVYDANTWIPKNNFRVPDNFAATDLSYDRTTGRLYGSFSNDESTYHFGWMDPATGIMTPILELADSYTVVAVNRLGQVYAINRDGDLLLVNKSTGRETAIGSTGLQPAGSQSGCFDPNGDGMYWCFRDAADRTALYSVNTATGAASLIGPFPMDEIVTGIYIEPAIADAAKAPAAASALKATSGANGTDITFTLPSTTTGGSRLNGSLSYTLLIDGIVVEQKAANAGAATKFTTSLDDGLHIATVIASNAGVQGEHSTLHFFVGADAPSAVANLKSERAGEVFKATWDAPTTSANGGSVDFGHLTYEVVFHCGNNTTVSTVSSPRFETTPALTIPTECVVEVTALNGEHRSATVESSPVLMGPAYNLPFSATFDNGDGVDNFMAYDANSDGATWIYDDVYNDMRTYYKMGNGDMDDWLFTPYFDLDPQNYYHMRVRVATAGRYYPETLEIKAGQNRSAEAMSVEVLPPTDFATDNAGQYIDTYFVPTAAGYWQIGFHAITKGENFFIAIDNLKLENGGVTSAPATPTAITATPAAGGALSCTISMNVPTLRLDGKPLGENVTVQVYRAGRKLKEMADAVPGSTITFEDVTGAQGTNSYEIRCFNSNGYGIPGTVTAYLGVDKPLPPTNVSISFNKDGEPVISWDAPAGGVNGGVIDYNAITYSVRRSFDSQYIAEGLKGNAATDKLGLDVVEQALMFYKVYAVTAAGTSEPAESEHFTMGRPYELPYWDSFKDMQQMKGPWLGILLDNPKGQWYVDEEGSNPAAIPVDNDGGLVTYAPTEAGHTSTLSTPLVCIDNADYPVLEFYVYGSRDDDSYLAVSIRTDESEPDEVWSAAMNDRKLSQGWNLISIPLDAYMGQKYVQAMFTAEAGEAYYNRIHLDCIRISDKQRFDVAAMALEAPETLVPGEQGSFRCTVANVGVEAVKNVSVMLMRGDTEVARTQIASLPAASTIFVILSDVAALDFDELEYYSFAVSAQDDKNLDNNTSRTVEVPVALPHYPVPSLKAHLEGEEAVLTWSKPDTKGVRAPVTDGFESYTSFAIDNVGDWTMHDIDGSTTVQLIDGEGNPIEYDNAGKPMAFQVFNPVEAGLTVVDEDGNPTVCATHRGRQMMCAFCDLDAYNNDWLVSPRLSGDAQTVSFFARSFVSSYGREAMIVMVSTTGTAVSDFKEFTDVVELPVDWTRYSIDLPAGTRYFAIRCISIDQLALCVDDVTFIPESSAAVDLELKGYNLYRNGELVKSFGPDATEHRIANFGNGGKYRLSAVYHLGESAHSAHVDLDDFLGVESVTVDANAPASSDIYNLQGVLIKRNASAADIKALAPGIYIIAGRKTLVK